MIASSTGVIAYCAYDEDCIAKEPKTNPADLCRKKTKQKDGGFMGGMATLLRIWEKWAKGE